MPRTRLFASLRRSLLLSIGAAKRGAPVLEHAEQQRAVWNSSRRDFIQKTAVAAGLLTLAIRQPLMACGDRMALPTGRKTAIIGAGLAGLMCARTLAKAGVSATVYEAQTRVGGRIWTSRDTMAGGQLVELGGEFIDSEHVIMRGLAAEFGLQVDDMLEVDRDVQSELFFFGGKFLSEAQILPAWAPLAVRIQADVAASEASPEEFARLDALSIVDYLAGVAGLDPTLKAVLELAYTGEFGLSPDQQSAFNLLWLIGSDDADVFKIYGTSDERFHLNGGNDAITSRIASELATPPVLGHALVEVRTLSDGRHRLSFEVAGGATVEAAFDDVVFALPWTTLREVRFEPALPAEKSSMIKDFGYGTNSKLMLQFGGRPWRTLYGSSGSAFTDSGAQTLWETSRGQSGDQGILTVFVGGEAGVAMGEGTREARAQAYLPAIDAVFPTASAAYLADSAVRMHWPSFPWMKGSYACYRPGQAAWAGTEGERYRNLFFCGEHTSVDFQGYMEGAAESGIRVAQEIVGG